MGSLAVIRWKTHVEKAALPLAMCVGLLLMDVAGRYLGVPTVETLVAFFKQAFEDYGLWALALAAMIEGLFLVSLYLPGSMVILSAIMFSDRSVAALSEIVVICWVAFMLVAVVNYYIGYYGLYRFFKKLGAERLIANTRAWMTRYGVLTYALAAFHPNYIGVVEVCSGISRQGLLKTLGLAGVAMAVTGPVLVFGMAMVVDSLVQEESMGSLFNVFVGLFALWAVVILGQGLWQDLKLNQLMQREI